MQYLPIADDADKVADHRLDESTIGTTPCRQLISASAWGASQILTGDLDDHVALAPIEQGDEGRLVKLALTKRPVIDGTELLVQNTLQCGLIAVPPPADGV